jgi:hypothetical protein
MTHKLIKTDNYLLVVDYSLTIGKGYALNTSYKLLLKYNTDQHLFYANDIVKKIIAHLPLNGSPILEGVDLLPPCSRHQEDGVEELGELESEVHGWGIYASQSEQYAIKHAYINGYNKAREKYKYTEDDVVHLLHKTARKYFQEGREYKGNMAIAGDPLHGVRRELINMVQSLHQYPTEFECEMEYYYHSSPKYYHDAGFVKCDESQYNIIRKTIPECETKIEPKTITTAQGVQWVGKYK